MKILSVKFQNLNSLKGVHEIRFDNPPFTEIGLFAITGPTGAGKTTILDAITVALYGRAHRHNSNVEEMMSRHTAECYSEVEFEINQQAYRAKWALRRSHGKSDGKVQPEKMELAEVESGKMLGGHTSTAVKQAIKELCGLDYNQFIRSVVLCQGDFTQFLKANDSQRSELLEKVTDTGIYSKISIFVHEKQKEENIKLENLQFQLEGVEVLTEEQQKEYERSLHGMEESEQELNEKTTSLNKQITWIQTINRLKEEQNRTSNELREKQQLQEQHQPDFERLHQHLKAVGYKPALVEIDEVQQQVDKTEGALKEQHQLLPGYQQAKERAGSDLLIAESAVLSAQQSLTTIEPVLEEVLKLDTDIQHAEEQVKKHQLQHQQSVQAIKTVQDDKVRHEHESGKIRQRLEELEIWLAGNKQDAALEKQLAVFLQQYEELKTLNAEIEKAIADKDQYQKREKKETKQLIEATEKVDLLKKEIGAEQDYLLKLTESLQADFAGKHLEMLEADAGHLPDEINVLRNQHGLAKDLESNKADQRSKQEGIEKLKQRIIKGQEHVQELATQKSEAEVALHDLRQLVELEQRIQKYDADRQRLKPKQPCPLCGAVHHPYVQDQYVSKVSEAEERRNVQEQQVTAINDRYNNSNVLLNRLQVESEAQKQELEKLMANQQEITQKLENNNRLLPNPLDNNDSALIVALLQQREAFYKSLQDDIQKLRSVNQQINDQQHKINKMEKSLEVARAAVATCQERLKALVENVEKITPQISQNQEKQTRLTNGIIALLEPYQVAFDYGRIREIEKALSERWTKYSEALQDQQRLKLNAAEVKVKIDSTTTSLAEKEREQAVREKELQINEKQLQELQSKRFGIFEKKDPRIERDRLNKELQHSRDAKDNTSQLLKAQEHNVNLTEDRIRQFSEALDLHRTRLQQLATQLQTALQQDGIESVAALKKLFLEESERQKITALEKEITSGIAALQKVLAAKDVEYKNEVSKEMTSEREDVLLPQLEQANKDFAALKEEMGRLKEMLRKDKETRDKLTGLTEQLELQKKEYKRWRELSDLIGSSDGKKFRRFAQGLTLARLTELANRHLIKFSDRYRIFKGNENDLELFIVDGYQADVIRPVSTLSGGESFLVSLALALGLSELASHKVQINSLFIDEGFGTLDADTLDIAVSALEDLEASGKTIGVISHIEMLKERIGIQIQVSKQSGGWSKIKVTAHQAK